MITYVHGDILNSKAAALVCPVNCVGIMGAGLAKQFKNNYPAYFVAYRNTCRAGLMHPGKMHVFPLNGPFTQYLISFPTKTHWRYRSSIEYIMDGLDALRQTIEYHSITSIAMPKIGCGLGGLPWNKVQEEIEQRLSNLSCNISVFL